jgi:hypothetical protein
MSTATPTWTDLGSNLGLRCEKSENKVPELSKGEETTKVKGGQVCNWAVVPRRISSAIFVPDSRQTDASHEHKQVKKYVC